MAHWSDIYPHKLYASVLLLDGKIENWKVSNHPKTHSFYFSGYWKLDRMNDYTSQYAEWEVNNQSEHSEVFQELSTEWFRQWPIAEDFVGWKPYEQEPKE